MKEIKLIPSEFYKFRTIALSLGICFSCFISGGVYTVEANTNQLEEIGY
jgi:hypothetical protein